MTDNYEQKYTKPDLRRRLKDEIRQSEKGGRSSQWSARKSQLLVQEYEKQGGGYKQNDKDKAAKSLEEWGEQDWQTQDGKKARQDGKTKRYLPKAVWSQLSDKEKQEAERIKQKASQEGEQYVEWTPAIKRAMEKAGYADDADKPTKQELYEQAQDLDLDGRSQMNKAELQAAIKENVVKDLHKQTRDELYEKAQDLDIDGRSKMNKQELAQAIEKQN